MSGGTQTHFGAITGNCGAVYMLSVCSTYNLKKKKQLSIVIKWNQKYIFCDLKITNFPLDAHWLDAQMFQLIPYVFVHSLEFDPS